ncbi:MAG: FecR domain-containing protein [Parabacteroides sp.]|nr:FecR domain-containing protein [Parabacteroides sp.]
MQEAAHSLIDTVHASEHVENELIESSLSEVEERLFGRPAVLQPRSRIIRIASVAACMAVLLSATLYLLLTDKESGRNLSAALLNEELVPEAASNDILLITPTDSINLQKEASIRYRTDGSVSVNNRTLTSGTREAQPVLNRLIVPNGKKAELALSDGTRMHVNAGSRVIYPAVFGKKTREIAIEGEVFLEVAKDATRPFVVKVNGFDVKVLGTTFNICAYKTDKEASVVLVEGKVEVKTARNETVELNPNQLVTITPSGTRCKEVEVGEYICWKDNIMWLSGRKAGDVFDKLARYYGRTIVFDSSVAGLVLQGKLDLSGSLADVLDMMSLSLSLTYFIDENSTVTICLKDSASRGQKQSLL